MTARLLKWLFPRHAYQAWEMKQLRAECQRREKTEAMLRLAVADRDDQIQTLRRRLDQIVQTGVIA